ncbi:MAG: acyltransferase [Thermoplasmata archaeon]|nr:acyltransferase [Thermoplasmata archaeon]
MTVELTDVKKLRRLGDGAKVFPMAKIVSPEVVEIGDHSFIDDFVFINGGQGVVIGNHVHIASFVSVIGGGKFIAQDYSDVACGSRILTGTNLKDGHMSTSSPRDLQSVTVGSVTLEQDVFVGSNCVLHPNVRMREGSVLGSNSLLLEDTEPWGIYVGSPAKRIGGRQRLPPDEELRRKLAGQTQ